MYNVINREIMILYSLPWAIITGSDRKAESSGSSEPASSMPSLSLDVHRNDAWLNHSCLLASNLSFADVHRKEKPSTTNIADTIIATSCFQCLLTASNHNGGEVAYSPTTPFLLFSSHTTLDDFRQCLKDAIALKPSLLHQP